MKQDIKLKTYLFLIIFISVIPVSIYATFIPMQIVEDPKTLKRIQNRLLNDSSYIFSQVEPVKSLEKDAVDNKNVDTTDTDEQLNDEGTDSEDDEDSDFNYTEEEDFDENLSEDTTVDLLYKDETVFEDEDEDEDSDFLYEDEKDLDDEDSEDSEDDEDEKDLDDGDSEDDEDDKSSDLKEITNDELVEENTTQDTNKNIKNTQDVQKKETSHLSDLDTAKKSQEQSITMPDQNDQRDIK